MELPIANYNRLIGAKILDGYERQINTLPQATMFGGKRMRNFVLAGSTDSDYPATLAVGRMDNEQPKTLGAEYFWKDFGRGFDSGSLAVGKGGKREESESESEKESESDEEMSGGKKITAKSFLKGLKKFGKSAVPVAKELGMVVAKEGIKEGIKAAAKGGRRKKAGIREGEYHILPVPKAESTFGKAPIKRGRKPRMPEPRPMKPSMMPMAEGGALLRNDPAEFHSSVYPPALASYNAQMPIGSRGSGRAPASAPAPAPKAKRTSARGKIVGEIMKKKGLSLAAASKYVKEHGLY